MIDLRAELSQSKLRRYFWEPIGFGLMAAGIYAVAILPFIPTDTQQQAIAELHALARNLAIGLAWWRIALVPALLKLLVAAKAALQGDDHDDNR